MEASLDTLKSVLLGWTPVMLSHHVSMDEIEVNQSQYHDMGDAKLNVLYMYRAVAQESTPQMLLDINFVAKFCKKKVVVRCLVCEG